MKRYELFGVAWMGLVFLAAPDRAFAGSAEVFLNVTRSEAVRIPLSLLYVTAPIPLTKHNSEVRVVLEGDLRRSQIFRIVLPPPFPELASGQPPGPEAVQRAGKQDIQAAVWIALSGQGEDM
ncbi:MAG TPA: hypothetical protein VI702_03210, partial [Nitrospiria bacterium]